MQEMIELIEIGKQRCLGKNCQCVYSFLQLIQFNYESIRILKINQTSKGKIRYLILTNTEQNLIKLIYVNKTSKVLGIKNTIEIKIS